MQGERRATEVAQRGWRSAGGRDVGGGLGDAGRVLDLPLSGATACVSLAADGSVRLRVAAGEALPPPLETRCERGPWRPVRGEARETDAGLVWICPTAPMRIEAARSPFALRVVDRHGAIVVTLSDLAFEDGGVTRVALQVAPGERFSGFGETAAGLDARGSRLAIDCDGPIGRGETRATIPFLLVRRAAGEGAGCCGLLLETAASARFDVAASRPDRVVLETAADGIDLLILPGPDVPDVVERLTDRLGRTPLPPLWALGLHQSWASHRSARGVRALAAEIRRRGIPSDALHLDAGAADRGRAFSWHPRRFPDPSALVGDLAQLGLRVVTPIAARVRADPEFPLYRDGLERDVFRRGPDGTPIVGDRGADAVPDFAREEVRAWWTACHRPLLDTGVAGLWDDERQPGWRRIPLPNRRAPRQGALGAQPLHASHRALEAQGDGRRPFALARSGCPGIQRYAAVRTSDPAGDWSALRASIPALLSLSLSGVPFCGADIGGSLGACTPELYARWVQLGALQPFARTHSTRGRRQEPWRFGARVERIAREALELRMRLLPYLYRLLRESEETGAPVWRPLFYAFPDDPACAGIDDQLLLGSSLLVAPVLERGARRRSVQLPPGSWYAWHDDGHYTGPRRIDVEAPLERIPLFVRGGSLLPTWSPIAHVGERPAEPLVLEVFPGDDGVAALVEDDGETVAYQQGDTASTALRLWSRAGGRLRFELSPREGRLRVPRRPLRIRFRACGVPDAVLLDGKRLPQRAEAPGWIARGGRVDVRLVDDGAGAAIEIDPAP